MKENLPTLPHPQVDMAHIKAQEPTLDPSQVDTTEERGVWDTALGVKKRMCVLLFETSNSFVRYRFYE